MFGETNEWVKKWGNKSILHRQIRTPHVPAVIDEIDPNIAVPRGWVCHSNEDLLAAWRELRTHGVLKVAVKPV